MTRNNYLHASVPSVENNKDGKVGSTPGGNDAFGDMNRRLEELELKYAKQYKDLSDEIERINNRLNRMGAGA